MVVKEVCGVLSFLAQQLKEGFDESADYFVPTLLKRTAERKDIMSSSANNCIRTIIEVCLTLGC